jgi:FKBP-type peptidyl-prolyl cis-trans isomerase
MTIRNRFTTLLLFTALLTLALVSCDPGKKLAAEERALIDAYLIGNPDLAFQLQPSGLYYFPVQQGTGIMPEIHDTAWVKYTGQFLNGTIFDSNIASADSLIFPVAEGWMIAGIDEAVTLMKVGEKAMFLLPSSLAYGQAGAYIIPGYTPLLFDLELVKATRGPAR